MVDRLQQVARLKEVAALKGVLPMDETADQGLGFKKGAAVPFINATRGMEKMMGGPMPATKQWGLNPVPRPQTANEMQSSLDQKMYKANQEGRVPGLTGEIGGSIAATAPTMLMKGPIALQGGVEGALMSESPTMGGKLQDAAMGAVTSAVGKGIFDAAGKIINPNIQNAASDLYKKGVEHLTPGQTFGGVAKSVEDALMSVPWVGDVIRNARVRGVEDFNKVLMNDVLAPIGGKIPDNIKQFGREAVTYVGNQLSDEYDKLLPQLTAMADNKFTLDMNAIVDKYAGQMSDEHLRTLNTILKNKIPKSLWTETGVDGKQYNRLMTSFKTLASQKRNSGQAEVADALTDLSSAFDDLLTRSNPNLAPQLQTLKTGWAKLSDVETAAARAGAESGLFTPAQYLSAIRSGDKSVRKRAFAGGKLPMQNFAEQAKETLPSKLPDSGTATRGAIMAGLGGFGGFTIDPVTGLLGAATTGMYTKPGQRLLNKGLFSRGPKAKTYAEFVKNLGPISGRLSTAAIANRK